MSYSEIIAKVEAELLQEFLKTRNVFEYCDIEMEAVTSHFAGKLDEEDLKLFRFIIMEAFNAGKNSK